MGQNYSIDAYQAYIWLSYFHMRYELETLQLSSPLYPKDTCKISLRSDKSFIPPLANECDHFWLEVYIVKFLSDLLVRNFFSVCHSIMKLCSQRDNRLTRTYLKSYNDPITTSYLRPPTNVTILGTQKKSLKCLAHLSTAYQIHDICQ